MPLWEIDFSAITSDAKIPADIDEEDDLPEGYNEEFEKVDSFIAENLQRAKETKDVALIGFIVEQGIARYSRLGLKKEVLDEQIWITTQLGKGLLQNFQNEAKRSELKTQIDYVAEMIADQKNKEKELRNRVASLRAERDFKKSRLEAVIRGNHGAMNEVSHINKRHALTQERLRLDTIEYEREKALRDDLRTTFIGYSEDLDRQLKNAPWLVEKQKEAARRAELEDQIKVLEADLAKIDMIEERNRIAEESERDLPFKQFCVQLAELYVKREKIFKQLAEAKANVKKQEEERRSRRALEDSSQMDCTQAILDGDLDDEETLMRMAKHYKIDTQNIKVPLSQMTMTQESQPPTQPICRKRAQSPAESSASSEANDDDISDGGEERTADVVPPPNKRVTIVEPIHNPDESVDEGALQMNTHKETTLDESVMEEDEQNEDRSQPEHMETDEREEEEEEEERNEVEEEEEEVEQQDQDDAPGSQESQVTVASQESFVQGEIVEQEEVEENDGFLRPFPLIPSKMAPIVGENEDIIENGDPDTSFNPELMLDISASSNDPGGDFFAMMNNQSASKQAVVDAAGGSPNAPADDGDFMSMFGSGGGGESTPADGDAASFSFNFGGGGDANETGGGGGGGGGEFNFFGF